MNVLHAQRAITLKYTEVQTIRTARMNDQNTVIKEDIVYQLRIYQMEKRNK